jgi:hypothetical protein
LSISTFGTKALTGSKTVLRKLEALPFFFAMLVAIVLEGAVVYWMFGHQLRVTPGGSLNVVGDWTGLALPQGWLLGAVLMLIYRIFTMFIPPTGWTDGEWLHNRRAFVRLWCLAIALLAMQSLLFFIGNVAAS